MRLHLATAAARPERPNEDFAAGSPNTVVLLDGAGAPAGMDSGCVHGTAWYARTLGGLLLAGTVSGRTLAEALAGAIESVNALHEGTCDLAHPGSPSSTVLAARVEQGHVDYLVLGDSVLVLDQLDGKPAAISDDRLATATRDLRKSMDALPTGTPEHTQALTDYITAMAEHRNIPGGFWTAGTDPEAAGYALTGSIPVEDLAAFALLSDGASRLVDRFGLTTWRQCLDLLARPGGADELIEQTRTAEADDPHGRRWPRGKTHDDATAVYVPLSD